MGYLGDSSKILKSIPEGVAINSQDLTTPEEAVEFVKQTKVDLLAPAVGNMHGILVGMNESGKPGSIKKRLNIERIAVIKKAVKIPLVLHGGSETADEDFVSAINAGVSIIHINTEIRLAWKNALERSMLQNKEEIAPYKILKPSLEAVKSVVKSRLQLFNKLV